MLGEPATKFNLGSGNQINLIFENTLKSKLFLKVSLLSVNILAE
jgi:hypothetical protein